MASARLATGLAEHVEGLRADVTEHRVKAAYEIARHTPRRPGDSGRYAAWFVVECACGWSSALHFSADAANDAYREHKERAVA